MKYKNKLVFNKRQDIAIRNCIEYFEIDSFQWHI